MPLIWLQPTLMSRFNPGRLSVPLMKCANSDEWLASRLCVQVAMLHDSLPVAPTRCMLSLVGLMHALISADHVTAMCAGMQHTSNGGSIISGRTAPIDPRTHGPRYYSACQLGNGLQV